MALAKFTFLKGRETKNGLAGYLATKLQKYGTATVASGATSIAVTDASIKTGDIIVASPLTKGTNACYIVGTAISDATSFTITVNTDPGTGGCVIAYFIIRP